MILVYILPEWHLLKEITVGWARRLCPRSIIFDTQRGHKQRAHPTSLSSNKPNGCIEAKVSAIHVLPLSIQVLKLVIGDRRSLCHARTITV